MKFLITVLSLAPTLLLSQNWMPNSNGETYNYRLQDSVHITHSIRIDSVKSVGNDVVFYLNRVGLPETFGSEPFILANQGQFLGQKMTLKPGGELIFEAGNFLFDTSIVLHQNAGLGDNWLAVPAENITASVTAITEGDVLGVPDSLKTIQFSNGATWILSKNHGLVSAPDFNAGNRQVSLSGLETQGLGERRYRFEDFFDFQPGDVLQYENYSSSLTGETFIQRKVNILEKTADSDQFKYRVKINQKTTQTGAINSVYYLDQEVDWIYKKDETQRVLAPNNAMVMMESNPFYYNAYANLHYFSGGVQLGIPVSPFNPPTACSVFTKPEDPNSPLISINDALECYPDAAFPSGYFEEFRPQLGRVKYQVSMIDLYLSETLIGAVIQGDTIWGGVNPDWFFTDANEPNNPPVFSMSPNPTSGIVLFNIPDAGENGRMQLLDIHGQCLQSIDIKQLNRLELNLGKYPSGWYMAVLSNEKGISSKIIVKE